MCYSKTGLKAFLLIMNVLLFLCGGVILGIGVWAVMDKIFLSYVIDDMLFNSASIITVVCGTLLVLVSFLGCGGTLSQKKPVVIIYIIILTAIFILLMTAAILSSVFQEDIETKVKTGMTKTLLENYGYMPDYNDENREITRAWDILQGRLQCCSVSDSGWDLYQSSRWFIDQYRDTNQNYVPESCCVYVGNLQQYQNLQRCQSFELGPPRYDYPGMATNPDLHYKGCFDSAKQIVLDQSSMLLAIGFSFCVFLITTIVLSIMFLSKVARPAGSANLRR